MRNRRLLCVLLVSLIASCRVPFDGAPCEGDDNCPDNQTCQNTVCVFGARPTENLVANDGGGRSQADGGVTVSDGGLAGSPSSHAFGEVAMGTRSVSFSFHIENIALQSSGTLSVALVGSGNASFVITDNGCTGMLASGGSCLVSVSFEPKELGEYAAAVQVGGIPGGDISLSISGTGIPQATLAISPVNANVGSVVLGHSSPSQEFTVRNLGGTASGMVTVAPSGTNASEFIINNSCQGPLAPRAQCTFSLILAPSSSGSKEATVTANALPGGSAAAVVTGAGLSPAALTGTPSPGVFSPTLEGNSSPEMTFTISNGGSSISPPLSTSIEGTNAGDFIVVSDACNTVAVAAGNVCTITIRFKPTEGGSRNGTLVVSGNGLVPVVIPIGGAALSAAQLLLSPSGVVNFGEVAVNASQTVVFGIVNAGQSTSGPMTVTTSGTDFSLASTTCSNTSLLSGSTCEVVVRFSPTSLGAKTGELSVTGSPGGTQMATLNGNAINPGALSITPSARDFGGVVLGQTSAVKTFTVTNTGALLTALPVVTVGGAGSGFSQTNTCTVGLAAGQTCTIEVTFAPDTGARYTQSGYVQVSATIGGTASGSITGKGIAPASLTPSPTTASFASTSVGSTGASTALVTLRNNGDQSTGALNLTMSSPDFAIVPETGDCRGATLTASASCTVRLAFSPQQAAARTGTLAVTAPAGINTSISLSGTGLSAAQIALTPASSADFGSLAVGTFISRTFILANAGDSPSGPITLGMTGTDADSFQNVTSSIPGNCVVGATLAAKAQCNLLYRFSANLPAGPKSATLSANASPGGTPTQALTGRATEPATLTPSVSVFSFGETEVGTASAAVFDWTLTNTGDVATPSLTTTGLTHYAIVADGCQAHALAPDASCTVRIAFSPAGPGSHSGSVTVGGTNVNATLNVNGIGMWRLKVDPAAEGRVESLDGKITNCIAGSVAGCSALFPDGAKPTLRARTSNGSGFHFYHWDAPSECALSGAECIVLMSASRAATPRFAPITHNLIFVTSSIVSPVLGSLAAYDNECNVYANAAGINNNSGNAFIAWMSSSNENPDKGGAESRAANRLKAVGTLKRLDGIPFVMSKNHLLNHRIHSPAFLDELGGRIVGIESIWTGTAFDGSPSGDDCEGWSSSSNPNPKGSATYGLATGGPGAWTRALNPLACKDSAARVLCMQNTSDEIMAEITIPTGGKRAFRSQPVSMPTSVSAANGICTTQAQANGLTGAYAALLAAEGTSAAQNALVDSNTYYRLDGARIGTGAQIAAGNLNSGFWQLPDGSFPLPPSDSSTPDFAWTGASSVTAVGTAATTCNNWSGTNPASVQLGDTHTSGAAFFVAATTACENKMYALYCLEQNVSP